MAQEQKNNVQSEQDDEEKIVLTKEEIAEARKMIKSVISNKEKTVMYGLAGVAAVTDVVNKVLPQFASLGYNYLGSKLGADYVNANTGNLFMSVSQYIYDKISYKMTEKLLHDYDARPEMDQNLLNPDKTASNMYIMADRSGQYMVQNAKKVLGITNVFSGALLTVGSLSAAATLPFSLAATSAAILGGSTAIGVGQHFLQKKLKTKKVENKEEISETRNNYIAFFRQMLINAQMRAKTLSDLQSYKALQRKKDEALQPTRGFLKTLAKYFAGLKGIEIAGATIAMGGALAAGMPILPAIALTAGVSTTIASLNAVSSAFLGVDEQKESFARRFKKYKNGIKDFSWGNENIRKNANVLQIDKIAYRFRNRDEKSEAFGEYTDKTAFITNEDIRIGPGVTLLSGASGAGKSTLIKLFNQADYVTEGAIRIGTVNKNGNFIGQDYRDLKHLEINKNIAFSEAQPQLSMETVDEYICRGNPNADKQTVEEIKKLLKIVSEEPELDKDGNPTGKMIPRTLDTISVDSSGEKTRLSIAQALIKDSPIMFFDEPTSGIDPETSKRIIEHLKNLGKQDKTIIFTTHKPEDIDQIEPYQAIDIDTLYSKDGKTKTIKKWPRVPPRIWEKFMQIYTKRTSDEKRAQEPKPQIEVKTQLDHARNLVKKRMNEGTNFAQDKDGNVITNGISEKDLMTYKQIKGKSPQDAQRETAALFAKIGRDSAQKDT